ncbi:MAG: response regulator [Bacillota bacterium]
MEILLVEDNRADINLISLILKEADSTINLNVVQNGQDAVDFLFRNDNYAEAPEPDFIILDINLPLMSGIEVLAEIKKDMRLKSIPVIIFSSTFTDEERKQVINLGCDSYFHKPLMLEDYESTVRSFIEFAPLRSSRFSEKFYEFEKVNGITKLRDDLLK